MNIRIWISWATLSLSCIHLKTDIILESQNMEGSMALI